MNNGIKLVLLFMLLVGNVHGNELTAFQYSALMKASTIPVEKDGSGYVGLWKCPITNKIIKHSDQLIVANLVPTKFATDNGGKGWPYATIRGFQEDMSNLVVADRGTIDKRADNHPTLWMPAVNQCGYLFQWDYVIGKYRILFPIEHVFAYERLIEQCEESVDAQLEGN